MNFSKYSGLGNDFVMIDDREESFSPASTPLLCSRKRGIGADGVILLQRSSCADVKMCIFNADGSEAEMCGNGLRCFMLFLLELGFSKGRYRIETFANILEAEHLEKSVRVDMGKPKKALWNVQPHVHLLNTGVPHAVQFVQGVKEFDLIAHAVQLRHHPLFGPGGANVTIAEEIAPHKLVFRTFERGVEGETEACGTGACAAALALAYTQRLTDPIKALTARGEELLISYSKEQDSFSSVTMEGEATPLFTGALLPGIMLDCLVKKEIFHETI